MYKATYAFLQIEFGSCHVSKRRETGRFVKGCLGSCLHMIAHDNVSNERGFRRFQIVRHIFTMMADARRLVCDSGASCIGVGRRKTWICLARLSSSRPN